MTRQYQCPNKKNKFRNWPSECLGKRRLENAAQFQLGEIHAYSMSTSKLHTHEIIYRSISTETFKETVI